MSIYVQYPQSSSVSTYPTFTDLPPLAAEGSLAITLDTDTLYVFDGSTVSWLAIGAPGSALAIGTIDSTAPSANGAKLVLSSLIMQSASVSFPGLVNLTTQSFAGNKTFTGSISAFNLSGTNTGDVTLGTANGLSLLGQVLSLDLSSTSTTGALSSTDWNTFNNKQPAGSYITDLTGDVTASGPGSVVATIANNAVTNAKLAQMPTLTIKGNNTGLTTDPLDLTTAQVKTMLDLAGTNSGDVTLTAVGSSPNANGASLSIQALTLQPADATNPGVLTALAQTFGGVKTMLNDVHTGYSDYNVISTPATPGAGVKRVYSTTSIGGATVLANIGPGGNQLILNQDAVTAATNGAGVTITRGQAVVVQGAAAGTPNVTLAQANTIAGSLVFGLVQSASTASLGIANIQYSGIVINVDTSAFSAGDTLYLSTSTPGALTNVAPTFPNLITKIGTVLVSSASVGSIILAIVNAVATPVAVSPIAFYFNPAASSDIVGYDQLTTTPATSAEVVFTGTGVSGVKTLIQAFATEPGSPSVVTLPAGTWFPKIYASVNNASGTNTVTVDVYKRATGGAETLLYSVVTPTLTTIATQYDLDTAQPAFTLLSTDRLVFKVSYTTTNATHVTSFYTADNIHNSLIVSTLTAAIGVELQANKDTANGYAGLDGSTLLKLAEFPVVPITKGGTGQVTANAAFNALSPLTTLGDLLTFTTVNARLGIGSPGQILTVVAGAPAWATASATSTATEDIFTLSGTDITNQYVDLAHVAQGASASINSVSLAVVGGPEQLKIVDYTVSLTGGVAGVTRITFAGDLATGGAAALVAADILMIQYSY